MCLPQQPLITLVLAVAVVAGKVVALVVAAAVLEQILEQLVALQAPVLVQEVAAAAED